MVESSLLLFYLHCCCVVHATIKEKAHGKINVGHIFTPPRNNFHLVFFWFFILREEGR